MNKSNTFSNGKTLTEDHVIMSLILIDQIYNILMKTAIDIEIPGLSIILN